MYFPLLQDCVFEGCQAPVWMNTVVEGQRREEWSRSHLTHTHHTPHCCHLNSNTHISLSPLLGMCTHTLILMCILLHTYFRCSPDLAEIISKRKTGGKWEFYVHYLSCEETHTHMHASTLAHTRICTHTCMHTHMYASMLTHTHTHTHTHTTHTHTHTHTNRHTSLPSQQAARRVGNGGTFGFGEATVAP